MILIFDLDDTIYPEIEFARSGFSEVIKVFKNRVPWNEEKSHLYFQTIIKLGGRDMVFNRWLTEMGIFSIELLEECITIYRNHYPKIKPYPEVLSFLEQYSYVRKYIITDGFYSIQKRKVDALKVERYFCQIYYTDVLGDEASKPSLHAFQIIKEIENVSWEQMAYIGDDPSKDFVNLNDVGMKTIRIKKGRFMRSEPLLEKYNAMKEFSVVSELISYIKELVNV